MLNRKSGELHMRIWTKKFTAKRLILKITFKKRNLQRKRTLKALEKTRKEKFKEKI